MLFLDNRRLGGPICRGEDQSIVGEELADTVTHCDQKQNEIQ